ncbi:hypothetical protein AG1IA_10139 [Rhizoctonia solani AG-1 IA]|uniref:Uncharacterized protein n=1 Tax=Thanatephorus cucumeris (strain AG1-IA) TaxID=983506 RepID=L8WCE7_THACA|nr:hypothetical protein AG1IA_10139 [Rhizoctonia solani AG-1 IA]
MTEFDRSNAFACRSLSALKRPGKALPGSHTPITSMTKSPVDNADSHITRSRLFVRIRPRPGGRLLDFDELVER